MYDVRNSGLTKLLCLVIFATNITQMPQLIGSEINTIILYSAWGILVLNVLLKGNMNSNSYFFKAIVLMVLFVVYCYVVGLLTRHNYIHSSMVYPFLLSTFVFCIGCLLSNRIDEIDFKALYKMYIISGLIVSIAVYYSAFAGGFSVMGRAYAYASKDSVSQILLSVLILAVFVEFKGFPSPLIRTIIALYMIYMLGILRSRASIIGIAVIAIYVFRNRSVKRSTKRLFILGAIAGLVVVFTNANAYNIVVNGILLAGRNVNNLNDITSGRMYMIQEFKMLFPSVWFGGIGSYYLESFPLSILVQYGVIGSLLLLLFCMLPIRIVRKCERDESITILTLLIVCYYLNGLFEELSPLGPGVKCYLLWFLAGLKSMEAQYGRAMFEGNI
ncbi:MAG: hypothetical protein IJU28_04130 [Clostridia bacterium]|nr:hypothetical protein [Clostridia bacterium]